MKSTCKSFGLYERYFSAHSLRKAAMSHMSSHGTSVEQRLDWGDYAPNSRVMSLTYDQATGIGPLGSNSLQGGRKPTVKVVERLLPAKRRSL